MDGCARTHAHGALHVLQVYVRLRAQLMAREHKLYGNTAAHENSWCAVLAPMLQGMRACVRHGTPCVRHGMLVAPAAHRPGARPLRRARGRSVRASVRGRCTRDGACGSGRRRSLRDIEYIVEEVWGGKSALSGKITTPQLCRWDPSKPPVLSNLLLLTSSEAELHVKSESPSALYSPELVAHINGRLSKVPSSLS